MKDLITFDSIEKVSDDLYPITKGVMLRINVALSRKNADGTKQLYHQEYGYSTNKYKNIPVSYTIRRSYDYFLSIETFGTIKRTYFTIQIRDMINLLNALDKVYQWTKIENVAAIYSKKRNKLSISKNAPYTNLQLKYGNIIRFDPIVIDSEDGVGAPGIRFDIGIENVYIDMDIDTFYGFKYVLDNINIFESAQHLVGYLGRPPLGSNTTTFQSANDSQYKEEPSDIKSRTIPKKKSFFDTMDDMGK